MYIVSNGPRWAPRFVDRPGLGGPLARTSHALARVRKLFTAYRNGMHFGPEQLRAALAQPLTASAEEVERLFALGWLSWVCGDPAGAEPLLHEATVRAGQEKATDQLAAAAYWRARVRLALKRHDAAAEYEAVMRTLGGSPQATAWFVDLLWRAGRVERAEQVWKSVRTNKRVLGCPDGPLLEARALLRRGEIAPAEKLLNDTTPIHCVLFAEKLLLLAWIRATQKQFDAAAGILDDVGKQPYPAAAVEEWRRLLAARRDTTSGASSAVAAPAVLVDLLRGHQARREGRTDDAVAAYRAALESSAAQPFARYALATLGHEDPAALLAGQPGLFLAVRCRAIAAVQHFRRRKLSAAELLDALQHAAHAGHQNETGRHFRQLAEILQIKQPTRDELQALVADHGASAPPVRRNIFVAALDQAVRRLPPADALALLGEWSRLEWVAADESLRLSVGKQMARLGLLARVDTIADAERLLPGDTLPALVRSLSRPEEQPGEALSAASAPAAAHLWRAAHTLQRFGREPTSPEALEASRAPVRQLRSDPRLRGLAQALLLQEAAQRGDAAAVGALLDEADHWRTFRAAPPDFVLRALEHVVSSQPAHPVWRRSLPRWLRLWDAAALGSTGATLAALAGADNTDAATAESPPGVARVPWLQHQAARALGRDDSAALTFLRRAVADQDEFDGLPNADAARAALPELERRAAAHALASAVAAEGAAPVSPVVLADAVEQVRALPDAETIVKALLSGGPRSGRKALAALAERAGLPPTLAHHLALIEQRAALAQEERDDPAAADTWMRAWRHWLTHLAARHQTDPARALLLDDLFARHRHRLNDLLARNSIDSARRYWKLIQELPQLTPDLGERVSRFRDELATEYLMTTREAMRYGEIPAGLHADYEKGLGFLRRLLSLDRDNLRLLTALVELCNEWFLDLYNLGPGSGLGEQIERFTPFALQLARLVEGRTGDLAARAQLADFYKFRGFISRDREQKIALYREALRFNPGNENVGNLLAELDPAADAPKGDE
jgi:hypothetical protein